MTTNRQVSIKGSTPTADLDLFGTFKVRDDAVFDSSVTSRSLYSYYLSISDNTSINRLSVGGDARFYLPTYFDSLMTANEIRAQLLGAGIIISDSAQLESVISSIINATRINGINIYSTKITAERINTDTVITVVLSCGNAKFTGTVLASDISTGNLSVTGTSTLHKIIVSDGVSITSLAGSNVGLIQYDTTGKLTRLDFTSNPNDILTGTGDFRNINTLVPPPDTGWQWYDTTVLLSTAPVVAIQNNLVVGNRVSIGSLRMSNGSATDTMTTDRRFALEAAKILLKADTVQLQNYATAREMTFDTVTTNKYAKVGSDTSKYNPPVTGTLALEVAGSATVKGDVAVKGSIASNTIATNDLTISSTISSPKIITSRITSPDSLIYFGDSSIAFNDNTDAIYTKVGGTKGTLNIQNQIQRIPLPGDPITLFINNTILNRYTGKVGIGIPNPLSKLHIEGETGLSPFRITNGNITKFFISDTGNVGIGTDNPQAKLDVNGHIRTSNGPLWTSNNWHVSLETPLGYAFRTTEASTINGHYYGYLGFGQTRSGWYWTFADGLDANANNVYPMKLEFDANGDGELTVCGTIRSLEWVVDDISGCDFVFENDYPLMPIKKRMATILAQKHLFYVEPAWKMQQYGANMKTTTMGMLRILEEHEKYLWYHDERMDELDKRMEKMEQLIIEKDEKILTLKKKINELKRK